MIQIFESFDLVLSNRDVTWFKHVILVMGVCHILPTYEQILTITKFVSIKFVAAMKRNRQLNNKCYCPGLDL
jgi:hypothetical protein